jgi:hypothetical protein
MSAGSDTQLANYKRRAKDLRSSKISFLHLLFIVTIRFSFGFHLDRRNMNTVMVNGKLPMLVWRPTMGMAVAVGIWAATMMHEPWCATTMASRGQTSMIISNSATREIATKVTMNSIIDYFNMVKKHAIKFKSLRYIYHFLQIIYFLLLLHN